MKNISRRKFLQNTVILPTLLTQSSFVQSLAKEKSISIKAVATWEFGLRAVDKSIQLMKNGSNSLDAVEESIRMIEEDPEIHTVGLGGYPDEKGVVTLDAAIMDWKGNAGSVAFLQNILHPISVARLVMEKTQHVMLAGEGALEFALKNGFSESNLLTKNGKDYWENKSKKNNGKDNHDTLGLIAIDSQGNMSVGVSTSGSYFKVHGRVGDSPIIGAGLYMDNNVGGAVATGKGEVSMKTVGSFLVVEKMREGYSPTEACKIAVERGMKLSTSNYNSISYLAMNKEGEVGAYSVFPIFNYAVGDANGSSLFKSKSIKKHAKR